jgi:EpsI family protein
MAARRYAQGEWSLRMTKLAVAFAFLMLTYYTDHFLARRIVIPERTSFESFPMRFGDWQCAERVRIDPEILSQLGATDYMICEYQRPATALVSLYVGYHASQVYEEGGGYGENSIHPPSHCLPGSGWDIIDSRTVALDLPGLPANAHAKRLVIARGEQRQLVYYWYQTQGRAIAEDWQKIFFVGYDRATRGRTDGALVRITIPLMPDEDEQRAEMAFDDFARRALPVLEPYLPE